MKKYLLILLLFTTILHAQSIRFQNDYTGGSNIFGMSPGDIEELPDSGFVMLTSAGQYPDSSMVLTRLDKWGNEVWSKEYRSSLYASSGKLHCLPQGGYFIVSENVVLRIDTGGNVLWSKRYSVPLGYTAVTGDGGLVAEASYPTGVDLKISVLKLDSSGNILWSTLIDTLVNNGVRGIVTVPLPNGSEQYMMIGACYQEYGFYAVLSCVSENGMLLWNKLFQPDLIFFDIALSADSSVYITGFGQGTDSLAIYSGLLFMKVNPFGNVEFVKVAGGGYAAIFMCTRGTEILITGAATNAASQTLFAIAFDSSMNATWSKNYHRPGKQLWGHEKAILLHDGGSATLAGCNVQNNTAFDLVLLRSDAIGNTSCNQTNVNVTWDAINWSDTFDYHQVPLSVTSQPETITVSQFEFITTIVCTSVDVVENASPTQFLVSPNPARSTFAITGCAPSAEVIIYDCTGKKVKTATDYSAGTAISTGDLNPGLYLLVVNGENAGKLIVE